MLGYHLSHPNSGDEVVVSGIAGHFPECNSIAELQEKLFDKVDLITEDDRRWPNTCSDAPQRVGKIKAINKFDAEFFEIDFNLAHNVEPMSRLLMERAYEAIIDAGVNPVELRSTRTGVFASVYLYENQITALYRRMNINQYGVVGSSMAGIATWISQWLGVTGPAQTVDTACSSSMYALEHAFKAIRNGECDAALVCGAHLCLHSKSSSQFNRMGILSPDGRCKSFDKSGDGYCRSETVAVCFLQKAKDSRRAYAQIVYSKTNCDGFKEEGANYPSGKMQRRLLGEFYKDCLVDPHTIEFLEAHGTGTSVGDPEELKNVDLFMSKNRTTPLFLGSIKSNLGHSEASSGFCALAKMCIAYHSGYIPPNLHFKEPIKIIEDAVNDGKLIIATDKHPWNRGLAVFSGFGFGGANAHVLLKDIARKKINCSLPKDDLPRLVCVSGRTSTAVERILNSLESKPVDVEEIRLWHAIHEHNIKKHNFRGYVVLQSSSSGSVTLVRGVKRFTENRSSICLVYSSMGVEASMAKQLLKIPSFAAAIDKCHNVLLGKNFNLKKLINDPNASQFNSSLNSILISISTHVALTNMLWTIGVQPEYVIGLREGEIYCAYANGLLTIEQAITIAYYYGMALKEDSINGSETQSFKIDDLNDNDISYQQRLFSYLKHILPNRVPWPQKWITVFQKAPTFQEIFSAKTLFDNLMQSFDKLEDLGSLIPSNAHTIVVGKRGPKNIFKNAVHFENGTTNAVHILLNSLGRLYCEGHNLKLANIYPQISFPVSQGTPMLSHLVEWDHRGDTFISKYDNFDAMYTDIERIVTVSLEDLNYEYLKGHVVGGRNLFPGTGYLVLVWETLASSMDRPYQEVPVVFENIRFHRATTIPSKGKLHFNISIQPVSGEFEITERKATVATGVIYVKKNVGQNFDQLPSLEYTDSERNRISHKDIYKEIRLRGYEYSGIYKGVLNSDVDGYHSRVSWPTSHFWDVFLDSILHVVILATDTRYLYLPSRIDKLSIDTDLHYKTLRKDSGANDTSIDVYFDKYSNVVRSGGVELRGLHCVLVPVKSNAIKPVYETYDFVPNISATRQKFEEVIRSCIELVLENLQAFKFKTIELMHEGCKNKRNVPFLIEVDKVLSDLPLVRPELTLFSEEPISEKDLPNNITVKKYISMEKNVVLVIGRNLLQKAEVLKTIKGCLLKDGFILSCEENEPDTEMIKGKYDVVASHVTESNHLIMFRKKRILNDKKVFINVDSKDQTFSWVAEGKKIIAEGKKIVFYGQDELNGVLGLVNCLRREQSGKLVYGFLITDPEAPSFDPNIEFYRDQIEKDLAINVFQDGQWGTYRHILIKEPYLIEPVENAFVNIETIGDLSTLKWYEGYFYDHHDGKQICVDVHCGALNFRDVVIASGRVAVDMVSRSRLRQQYVQGLEIAGVTLNGKRVFGTVDCQGIATRVYSAPERFFCVPDEWSLEEAVTIPVAYCTVFLAFEVLGKLKRGETVLIHAGTGGVGQAAIYVALHYGCEVFTTVGSAEKRDFIKKLFPQLKDSHIASTRDTYFEEMIYKETNGKGVDVVLNSLADDKLLASVRCLGYRGRFLELGKYDIFRNTSIDMFFHDKEISFHGVMFDYSHDYRSLEKLLIELVMKGIVAGAVRPLTYCTFDRNEIESANRYMAAGKHIGKVVIKIRDEVPTKNPAPLLVEAHRRLICPRHYVYVLVGGLGGFGLELADWLVLRGATRLLLVSSRGISTGYQAQRIKIWESYGSNIQISTHDITTEAGCIDMLKQANSMGHVEAIFNLAAVLTDALFQQQSAETFKTSFGPKAVATKLLDKVSRVICPGLRHFVVFSSISCGRGNTGQSNYGMANSVMERVCEKRRREGFPGLAIQWGAVGDVGLVANMQIDDRTFEIGGTVPQRINTCLKSLDRFLLMDCPIVSSYVLAEKKFKGTQKRTAVDVVLEIMGIKNLKSISLQAKLADLGVDSMTALEIKQTLDTEFEITLTPDELKSLTLARLVTLSNERFQSEVSSAQGLI